VVVAARAALPGVVVLAMERASTMSTCWISYRIGLLDSLGRDKIANGAKNYAKVGEL
jgi:hypothetical protein